MSFSTCKLRILSKQHCNILMSQRAILNPFNLKPFPPHPAPTPVKRDLAGTPLLSAPSLDASLAGRQKNQESTTVPMVAQTQPRLYPSGTKKAACYLRRRGVLPRCYLYFLQVAEENRNLSLQAHSKKHCNTIRCIRIIIIAFRQMLSITLSKD